MNIYLLIWFALSIVGVGLQSASAKSTMLFITPWIGFALSLWLLYMGGAFKGVGW